MQLMRIYCFLTAIASFTAPSSQAQVMLKRTAEGGEGVFHLQELQTFLTSKNDTVRVLMVLPTDLRPKGYEDITIKESDAILMLNAKRVKTVKQVEDIYNGLETGATLKMGIRRNGEFFIESLKKVDPKDLPKDRKLKFQLDTSGEGAEHAGGAIVKNPENKRWRSGSGIHGLTSLVGHRLGARI